jgi:hypothetical protein
MKRRFLFCLLAAFVLPARCPAAPLPQGTGAHATSTKETLPTAQEIVQRFLAAVGGKQAWDGLHSRIRTGTIEFTEVGLKGTVELEEKAPDKILLVANVPGIGEFRRGYDGTTGWSQDPREGLRLLKGSELADTRREAEFSMPLELMKIYPHMEVTGKEKVDGSDAYEVKAIASDGAARTFDFDTKTGYLIRIAGKDDSPGSSVPVELFLEDYKKFDGVMLPTVHRQTTPVPLTMTFTDVKQNVPIADAIFTPPKAQ